MKTHQLHGCVLCLSGAALLSDRRRGFSSGVDFERGAIRLARSHVHVRVAAFGARRRGRRRHESAHVLVLVRAGRRERRLNRRVERGRLLHSRRSGSGSCAVTRGGHRRCASRLDAFAHADHRRLRLPTLTPLERTLQIQKRMHVKCTVNSYKMRIKINTTYEEPTSLKG